MINIPLMAAGVTTRREKKKREEVASKNSSRARQTSRGTDEIHVHCLGGKGKGMEMAITGGNDQLTGKKGGPGECAYEMGRHPRNHRIQANTPDIARGGSVRCHVEIPLKGKVKEKKSSHRCAGGAKTVLMRRKKKRGYGIPLLHEEEKGRPSGGFL